MVTRDPNSEIPDIGDGWWDRLAEAVRSRQGAENTLWNGRLDFLVPSNPSLAQVDQDSTIRLHPLLVETLSGLHRDGGAAVRDDPVTAARSHRYIEAAATAFAQLTVSEQDWMTPAVRADYLRGRPDMVLREVGFAETHTRAVMPELVRDVLPPDLAGRLNEARAERAGREPAESSASAAVTAFANTVSAQVAARSADGIYDSSAASAIEVLRVAAREDANTAGHALGDLLYDSSRLPFLVHEQDQQMRAQHAIEEPIHLRLGELEWLSPDQSSKAPEYGVRAAEQAGAAVRSWELRYDQKNGGGLDPLSGMTPPGQIAGMPHGDPDKAHRKQSGPAGRQNEL